MSLSSYQMLFETENWVSNSDGSMFNDFVGFGGTNRISYLPEDPFCMNIRSTLNTISDWFHENQICSVSDSHDVPFCADQKLYESLGCFCNGDEVLQHKISSRKMNDFEGLGKVGLPEDPFCMEAKPSVITISDWFHENHKGLVLESRDESTDRDDEGEEPHDAFEIILPYLAMKDLLAVEGVCRSLRDSVRKEPFLWRTIDLHNTFCKRKVTDDSLLKLTDRAQGNLQCLNLGGCAGITDNGLMQVLANNQSLAKLCVSSCIGLSTEGLLSILRELKSSNRLNLKSLITGGTLYFNKEQLVELNLLLGAADAKAGQNPRMQRLYTSCRSEFSLEDDLVTDLEICPWCEKPGLVFDCASERCPLKDHPCPKSSCRACVVCIERCHDCGSCLTDYEHLPFCFAKSCVDCYMKRS
ncbi:unnamed protein product [Cochlearia groenlandica]